MVTNYIFKPYEEFFGLSEHEKELYLDEMEYIINDFVMECIRLVGRENIDLIYENDNVITVRVNTNPQDFETIRKIDIYYDNSDDLVWELDKKYSRVK